MEDTQTSKSEKIDLSIVIVSWNVLEILKENLKAIFENTSNISFEVIVVDNNSSDKSSQILAQEFPTVKVISNSENVGFSRACNQGVDVSRGRYILLLNPDMKIMFGTLDKMVYWMDRKEEAAIATCQLLDRDRINMPIVRQFPRLSDQLAIVLKIPHIFPGVLNKYLQKDFDYNKEMEVDSIRGSFFLLRRSTIENLGKLDENFFIWFEEVDYCQRARKAGLKIFYTPVTQCVDLFGQSFKQVGRGQTQKYFRDSMLYYFFKWHPYWQHFVLKIAWLFGLFLSKLSFKSRHKT